jgi:hypothetical protein
LKERRGLHQSRAASTPLANGEKALISENEKSKGKNRYAVFSFDAAPP